MLRLVGNSLWDEMAVLAAQEVTKLAAVAYVSDDSIIRFRKGDTLVVDASDKTIALGQTSAKLLKEALKRQARLVSIPGLHAKILIFGTTAVVGSSNISKSSRQDLFESAVITNRPEVVAKAVQIIEELAKQGDVINEKFVSRILKIKVKRSSGVKYHAKGAVSDEQPKAWIIVGDNDAEYPGDKEIIEKINQTVAKDNSGANVETDWIWWPDRSTFVRDAKAGDILVYLETPKHSDTSPRHIQAYKHATIQRVFQEKGQKAKTFHCTWHADSEATSLNWSEFKSLARRAELKREVGRYTCRKLSEKESSALFELWPK
ncbi:hypothetical protein GPROT1_01304 [Gammaproteobacteria bacterium]|nr:hypothetical protein GPROT1_01304 [Gammaproteobacteria bacterium]